MDEKTKGRIERLQMRIMKAEATIEKAKAQMTKVLAKTQGVEIGSTVSYEGFNFKVSKIDLIGVKKPAIQLTGKPLLSSGGLAKAPARELGAKWKLVAEEKVAKAPVRRGRPPKAASGRKPGRPRKNAPVEAAMAA